MENTPNKLSQQHVASAMIRKSRKLSKEASSARKIANSLKRDANKSARIAEDMIGTVWAGQSALLAQEAAERAYAAASAYKSIARQSARAKQKTTWALKPLTKREKKIIRENLKNRLDTYQTTKADQQYLANVRRIREQVMAERQGQEKKNLTKLVKSS